MNRLLSLSFSIYGKNSHISYLPAVPSTGLLVIVCDCNSGGNATSPCTSLYACVGVAPYAGGGLIARGLKGLIGGGLAGGGFIVCVAIGGALIVGLCMGPCDCIGGTGLTLSTVGPLYCGVRSYTVYGPGCCGGLGGIAAIWRSNSRILWFRPHLQAAETAMKMAKPPPTAMPIMAALLRGCEVPLSAVDVDVDVGALVICDVPEPARFVVRLAFDAPVALAMGSVALTMRVVATAPTPT